MEDPYFQGRPVPVSIYLDNEGQSTEEADMHILVVVEECRGNFERCIGPLERFQHSVYGPDLIGRSSRGIEPLYKLTVDQQDPSYGRIRQVQVQLLGWPIVALPQIHCLRLTL